MYKLFLVLYIILMSDMLLSGSADFGGIAVYTMSYGISRSSETRHRILLHRHTMTSSNGSIFHVTGPLWPATGGFPSQRPVSRNFDVFFDLRLTQLLNKWCRRRWFGTPSRSLWRHSNEDARLIVRNCGTRICTPDSFSDWTEPYGWYAFDDRWVCVQLQIYGTACPQVQTYVLDTVQWWMNVCDYRYIGKHIRLFHGDKTPSEHVLGYWPAGGASYMNARSRNKQLCAISYTDVLAWKCFLHHWPFVRGINWSTSHKRLDMWSFWCFVR